MKRFKVNPVLLLILVVVVSLAASSIAEHNRQPDEEYWFPVTSILNVRIGQHVEVKGVVDDVHISTSRKPYETFYLCDADFPYYKYQHHIGCIQVFTSGHPRIKSSDTLYVRGTVETIREGAHWIVADKGWL